MLDIKLNLNLSGTLYQITDNQIFLYKSHNTNGIKIESGNLQQNILIHYFIPHSVFYDIFDDFAALDISHVQFTFVVRYIRIFQNPRS